MCSILVTLINIFSLQSSVHAQVILDGSMGTDARLHWPDYDIKVGYGARQEQTCFTVSTHSIIPSKALYIGRNRYYYTEENIMIG